jgi:hypothetical protein
MILLSSLLLGGLLFGTGQSKDVDSPPDSASTALGCLVAREFIRHDLQDLGLAPGRLAWVRYYIGSIPAMEPTPGEFYIAVYAEDGLRGWLLLSFRDQKGKFIAVRNAYRLTKAGSRWNADEGNGGLATYKAMGQFATKLEKSPRYRVKLEPCTQGCAPPSEY